MSQFLQTSPPSSPRRLPAKAAGLSPRALMERLDARLEILGPEWLPAVSGDMGNKTVTVVWLKPG